MPARASAVPHVLLLLVALLGAGCASPPGAWRAGALRDDPPDTPLEPTAVAEVEVHYKERFGPFEETEARRLFACATTTVLRRASLVDEALRGDAPVGEPERDYEVLAALTTEEFPRDEAASEIETDTFSTVFGIGDTPIDLFVVRPDPAFFPAAVRRLRQQAAALGADAVIEVFVTGEAEHHMWVGTALGFDTRATSSPLYAAGTVLDFQLRDVRLHGLAVRYDAE